MSITLYKRAKKSKILTWEVWIEEENGYPTIMMKSGFIDGKQNVKKKIIRKGTNIGKTNEKTAIKQAMFLMDNMIQAKIEDNMVESLDDIDLPQKYMYPMLAKTFDPKKKFVGPVFVQPKMDGARCFGGKKFENKNLLSRQLNAFENIEHVKKALDDVIFPDLFSPDGEIYIHGVDFQTIISLLKKFYKRGDKELANEVEFNLGTEDLEYWIYDLAIDTMPFHKRHELLDHYIPDNHSILKKVPTIKIYEASQIDYFHDKWVNMGYEGLIVRDIYGTYEFNERSKFLQKYKKFTDEEYKIVGFEKEEYTDIDGVLHNLVIWICETEDGQRFSSRPRGTFPAREKLYNEAGQHIGKMLTVRKQGESQDGVPRMNVGIAIRDYE